MNRHRENSRKLKISERYKKQRLREKKRMLRLQLRRKLRVSLKKF